MTDELRHPINGKPNTEYLLELSFLVGVIELTKNMLASAVNTPLLTTGTVWLLIKVNM